MKSTTKKKKAQWNIEFSSEEIIAIGKKAYEEWEGRSMISALSTTGGGNFQKKPLSSQTTRPVLRRRKPGSWRFNLSDE